MARRPTQIGHAGAPLRLVPLSPDHVISGGEADGEDERTTVEQPPDEPPVNGTGTAATAGRPIDEHWDDGTTIDEATMAGSVPQPEGFGGAEELTVEEGRPALARLVVIAGNDTGREFPLTPGKLMTIGRAIDNDVVLTDIAVSRKHLDVVWEDAWILKDRGSGNGTLVNDRIEENQCRLQHGDRIEIGHTVFRFDHAGAAALGWGPQNDDEASTVAGRQPPRPTVKGPPPVNVPAAGRRTGGTVPPPMPAGAARATLPPPARPRTGSQGGGAGGAVSSRLALPANPGTMTGEESVLAGAARGEPSFLSAAGLASEAMQVRAEGRHEMRTMTATSHVDPLPYGSGSMPPVGAYPMAGAPLPGRKVLAIAVAVVAGFTLIGLIAMIAGGDDPPEAPATSAKEAVAPAPEPEPANLPDAVAVAEPAPAVEPEPEPDIEPEPEPDLEPLPKVTIEPAVVEPAPPPEVKQPPPEVKPAPVAPPKIEKGITRPDPRKKPETKKPPPPKVQARKEKAPAPPTSVAAAKKKAQSLYAGKDFKAAAAAARSAAANAEGSEAAALDKLAGDYEALNSAMNAGNAAAASKPTDALAAYRRALAADKRLGGTHAPMIREKLGAVAPKAAAGFMAKGNYEAAKQAADTAVNFGAGSSATVTQVRQSLERKARELYANGQKLLETRPDEGKALLRRVQKIVPPDSPWYIKAYKALNSRTKTRDDDE